MENENKTSLHEGDGTPPSQEGNDTSEKDGNDFSPLTENKKDMKKSRHYMFLIAAVVVVVLIALFLFSSNDGDVVTHTVEKETVTHIAEFSGTVVPADKVELAFEVSGRVLGVAVDVGSSVNAGQVLARLVSSGEQAQIRAAEAELEAAQARLSDLERGARPEELSVQQQKITNAETSIADARLSMINAIQKSFTAADDAVRNRVDGLFTNSRTLTPELVFNTDFQLETDIESGRATLERDLTDWEQMLKESSLEENTETARAEAASVTEGVKNFLSNIAFAVNKLTPTASYSATTLDGWKTDIATARTNVDTALSNLTASQEVLNAALAAMELAEEELILIEAGATEEQLDEARANVAAKRALLDQYRSDVAKRVLVSPITGTVTERSLEPGEIVQAQSHVISVISNAAFEIEANASELDIGGILVGNTARIILDAYGDEEVFDASVTEIDPAETIIDNVPTYGVTLQFVEQDERVRSGMTANVFVVTKEVTDVVAVPVNLISFSDEEPTVRIISGDEIVETPIVLGLRGSNGLVEVIGGLKEGDHIVQD